MFQLPRAEQAKPRQIAVQVERRRPDLVAASAHPVPTLLESLQFSNMYKSHATKGKNKIVCFSRYEPPHQASPII